MARGGRVRPGLLIPLACLLLLVLATLLPSLLRGGGRREATGRVRASGGGPAPAGTRVTARFGSRSEEVLTNGRGEFRLSFVPEGQGTCVAVWGPLRAEVRAGPGAVRISLPPTFRLAGRVVDGMTGEAIPGARARCGEVEGVTDERGRFRFESVPAPRGRPPALEVAAPGYRLLLLEPTPDDPWDDLFLRLAR